MKKRFIITLVVVIVLVLIVGIIAIGIGLYHDFKQESELISECEQIKELTNEENLDTEKINEMLTRRISDGEYLQVEEALKVACAWDFVEKMPKGINTALGERGRGLSEGQAQRIAIARAVLRDAPILLLDEATSALDVTTERRVLKNIITQRPNKTCIVTTHRPSVLNLCKRVYRVVDTKVTELSEEESSKMAIDF